MWNAWIYAFWRCKNYLSTRRFAEPKFRKISFFHDGYRSTIMFTPHIWILYIEICCLALVTLHFDLLEHVFPFKHRMSAPASAGTNLGRKPWHFSVIRAIKWSEQCDYKAICSVYFRNVLYRLMVGVYAQLLQHSRDEKQRVPSRLRSPHEGWDGVIPGQSV